jgi:hypothetical protein
LAKIKSKRKLTEVLREHGYFATSPGGGWVTIHGNRMAPRGMRIPRLIRELGIQHLDIYWAKDEELCFRVPTLRSMKGLRGAPDDEDEQDIHNYAMWWADALGVSLAFQGLTWMSIVTPNPEHIRFHYGEVTPISEELIGRLLEEGGLEVIRFGAGSSPNPVWEEATRDIMDSLRLDGMSFGEAQYELARLNLIERTDFKIPQWYYRPIGWYRKVFCEEEN